MPARYKGQNYYRNDGEFVHENCQYCGKRFWEKDQKGSILFNKMSRLLASRKAAHRRIRMPGKAG
jgi:hypothetical protein